MKLYKIQQELKGNLKKKRSKDKIEKKVITDNLHGMKQVVDKTEEYVTKL